MKLPQKFNQIFEKAGITEVEFFSGTKKQWIISILIILSPLLFFLALIIAIAIKFWPITLEKLSALF